MGTGVRATALGAGALALYAATEPYLYRLQRHTLAGTPRTPSLTVLHVSDTHLNTRDKRLMSFLRGLPERVGVPDLVVATGDLIEENEAIDPIVELLGGLRARLGRFYVFGSHDYYIGKRPSYRKYFSSEREVKRADDADTPRLEEGLRAAGWQALTNTTVMVEDAGTKIRLSGVDDPYLKRHRTDHIERGDEDLAIALVHAPDVVSEWALRGFDLILAGHTHGGQVRFPGIGALVTNSSLPAGLAAGPQRVGRTWLHVSPGLGTGKFSPIRFATRPEATLLRLVPAH